MRNSSTCPPRRALSALMRKGPHRLLLPSGALALTPAGRRCARWQAAAATVAIQMHMLLFKMEDKLPALSVLAGKRVGAAAA